MNTVITKKSMLCLDADHKTEWCVVCVVFFAEGQELDTDDQTMFKESPFFLVTIVEQLEPPN